MVRCPKPDCECLAKVIDLNYASVKLEGEPANSSDFLPIMFQCQVCGHIWESDPKADKLYDEYAELAKERRSVAQMMGPGGSYQVQHLDIEKLMRRNEIAKELINKYQSHLDLPPDVWHEIALDSA